MRVVGEDAIQIDFRYKGERCRERVRLAATKANVAYCRGWKRRIEDEIAHGSFDYAKHFPDSKRAMELRDSAAGPKLSEYMRSYVQSLDKQVQPETLKEYTNDAETIIAGLGDPYLRNLKRADIRNWIAKLDLSKNRIDNLLKPLRGSLRQALDDEIIAKDPLKGYEVKRIKTDTEVEVDPFTPEEIEALGETPLGDLWTFWAWSGLRSGEIIGLQQGDVSENFDRVDIRRTVRRGRAKVPKTDAGSRTIELLAPAHDALRRVAEAHELWRKDPSAPVFLNPNTGGWFHEAKALNRAFARACKAAKVRRRYVYQLRHTFATWGLSAGENPWWVAKRMGHENVQMLYDHYGKWMKELDAKAGLRMLEAAMPKARRGQRAA